MAPKRVLRSPPPLPSETISFSTNGHTTGTTGNKFYSFGSSQLMDVGTAATWIPASAVLRLSTKFYRTAGLAHPFFRMIKKARSLFLFLFCQSGSNPRNILWYAYIFGKHWSNDSSTYDPCRRFSCEDYYRLRLPHLIHHLNFFIVSQNNAPHTVFPWF